MISGCLIRPRHRHHPAPLSACELSCSDAKIHTCHCLLRRTRYDPKKHFSVAQSRAIPQNAEEASAHATRKVEHAVNSITGSSHRGGYPPMAGESLHSHAGDDQINFQRHRGHCRGSVDPQCHWVVPFSSQHPPWEGMTSGKRWLYLIAGPTTKTIA